MRSILPIPVCLLLVLGAGCGKKDYPPDIPDPAMREASQERLKGLTVAIEYLRRQDNRLVIGFHLAQCLREGAWWIRSSEWARVYFWDRDGQLLAGPFKHDFDVPEAFESGQALTMSVKLIVPCPERAAWVAVEIGTSGLRTKKVAIPQ